MRRAARAFAAPISRSVIVLGNMAVALRSAPQVGVPMASDGCAAHPTRPQEVLLSSSAPYSRSPSSYGTADPGQPDPQPGGIAGLTPVADPPPVFAGSRFLISAPSARLIARIMPTTDALALPRWAPDRAGAGLHDIWGIASTIADASMSLLVPPPGRFSSPQQPSGSSSVQQ
jgi:hypothetical protein